MSKTMRKVVAFAAMAAMAVGMIPTASAGSTYLLIDKVEKNTSEYTRVKFNEYRDTTKGVNQELKDAVDSMKISYDQANNTVTIKQLPSSVPYIRPREYCPEYTADAFNYAPYLPLTVWLGLYSNSSTYYEDISKFTEIKVDGEIYKPYSEVSESVITLAQVAYLMKDGTYLQDDTSFILPASSKKSLLSLLFPEAKTTAQEKEAGFINPNVDKEVGKRPYPFDDTYNVREQTPTEAGYIMGHFAGLNINFSFADPSAPIANNTAVYYEVAAKLEADPRIIAMRAALPNKADQAVIDAFIKGVAQAAYDACGTSVVNLVAIMNAMAKYWVDAYSDVGTGPLNTSYTTLTSAKQKALLTSPEHDKPTQLATFYSGTNNSTTGPYFPIHVYHDLRESASTHTVEITINNETFKRSFTVVNNFQSSYAIQSAKKIAGVNYENMIATADSGNLFIQYAMKDLLATDTWGTVSSAYKLWDRSNFTLAGTWLSFKDTVKQGDTVFFNTNVTLVNDKGEKIPAGTKLTLQFSKQAHEQRYFNWGNVKDYSYQYSNKSTVTVKDDNSFDFQLALDKYDMEWLYNGHQQNYVQVSVNDSDDKYQGSFYVRFSARDRIATTVSFAEGTRIQLKVGESKDINAVLLENAMSTTIGSWTSANAAIATVSGNGLKASVTGVSVGTTVITAATPAGETGTIIVDVVGETTTEVPSTVKTFKVVTTSTRLNVRSGAGTSYSIIGKLDKGATFQGEANEAGDWIKLNYNGQTGYVSSKYVVAQ